MKSLEFVLEIIWPLHMYRNGINKSTNNQITHEK